MKRHFLVFAAFFILSAGSFAQESDTAVAKVLDIEEIKLAIHNQESAELRAVLENEYLSLENTVFTENSLGQSITVSVGSYNVQKQAWPVTISSLLFGSKNLFTLTVDLTYADVMGKRFVPEAQMTPRQLTDYQESVSAYDEQLHNKGNILVAELYYKVYRWAGASEYRLVPQMCTISNSRLKNKIIFSTAFTAPVNTLGTFTVTPQIEVRSPAEINADINRAKKILAREAQDTLDALKEAAPAEKTTATKVKEAEKKEPGTNQKGRQGVFVLADLDRTDWDFSSLESAINFSPSLQGDFSFGLGKFFFLGFDLGVNFETNTYYLGYFNGLNCRLGKHILPYIRLGADARTDGNLDVHLGGGTDFTFGGASIALGYSYTLRYALTSGLTTEEILKNPSKIHSIYAGVGISW